MDFLSLAINYLLSMFIGISLDTLFSNFYTADRHFQEEHINTINDVYNYEVDIFDFIIVGAGSAGCVLANRLSAHNYRILLLEAGGNPFPLTSVPGLAPKLIRNPNIDWGFQSAPQKHSFKAYKNNSYVIHRGKGLGGSSMLNYNMYMRGSPYDFEEWANITDDDSWRYENLLPFFNKIENYHGYFPKNDYHGNNGPLHIESPVFFPMRDEWFEAGIEMGLELKDPNVLQSESVFPVDTSTQSGTRFSAHRAYLNAIMGRSNLKVVTYAHVQKIILNEKNQAVAVSYIHNGKMHQAVATREIVISAGAISSPQLLMLSGIGPKEHLESLGIPVKVDLPVGKNFRDHYLVILGPVLVDKGKSIMADRDFDSAAIHNYIYAGVGPYGSSGFQAGALLTSSLAAKRDWPDIYLTHWPIGPSVSTPLNQEKLFGTKPGLLKKYMEADLGTDGFLTLVVLAKPKSYGEIRLASIDPNEHPIIDPNFLSHPDDVKVLVEGIKKTLKMTTETKAFLKIGARFTNSSFPGCDNLTRLSDDYWECYARHYCHSMYHPSGTCRMGRQGDPSAVLDSRLRVLGTIGLRVIDASVMPQVTTTNTNAPTIMIAEKGAQMIINDWDF